MNTVCFGEHRTKRERESSRQKINSSLCVVGVSTKEGKRQSLIKNVCFRSRNPCHSETLKLHSHFLFVLSPFFFWQIKKSLSDGKPRACRSSQVEGRNIHIPPICQKPLRNSRMNSPKKIFIIRFAFQLSSDWKEFFQFPCETCNIYNFQILENIFNSDSLRTTMPVNKGK
jgi:hypothetical protein